jgi:hypothetical protein
MKFNIHSQTHEKNPTQNKDYPMNKDQSRGSLFNSGENKTTFIQSPHLLQHWCFLTSMTVHVYLFIIKILGKNESN